MQKTFFLMSFFSPSTAHPSQHIWTSCRPLLFGWYWTQMDPSVLSLISGPKPSASGAGILYCRERNTHCQENIITIQADKRYVQYPYLETKQAELSDLLASALFNVIHCGVSKHAAVRIRILLTRTMCGSCYLLDRW